MLKIEQDDLAARNFLRMLGNIAEQPAPKAEVLQYMHDQIDLGFTLQRDPYGDAWTPLSEATLQIRLLEGISGTQILVASGEMRASLRIEGDEVQMDEPASYHQEDGISALGRATGFRPARKIFPIIEGTAILPMAWEKSIIDIYETWVEEQGAKT